MEDLNNKNPEFARPSTLCSLSAWLPLLLSCCALALASGAAPTVPVRENPIFLACGVLALISAVFVVVPLMCKWSWEAKYFGKASLDLASISLLGIVPMCCILLYGTVGVWLKVLIGIAYGGAITLSCRPVARLYAAANKTMALRTILYREAPDAIYYCTLHDNLLMKRARLSLTPSAYWFLTCFGIAACALFFPQEAIFASGIPRPHWFLLVVALPITMMGFSVGTRGWLTCYWYPHKNRNRSGKPTYVDMATSTSIDPAALRRLRQILRQGHRKGR